MSIIMDTLLQVRVLALIILGIPFWFFNRNIFNRGKKGRTLGLGLELRPIIHFLLLFFFNQSL